jgi:hypothetical protein
MALPHAYRALPEASRREVRMEVQSRGIEMSFEMLIGSGRA